MARTSVSHVHNALWQGDRAYLFDAGINASDLFETMTVRLSLTGSALSVCSVCVLCLSVCSV